MPTHVLAMINLLTYQVKKETSFLYHIISEPILWVARGGDSSDDLVYYDQSITTVSARAIGVVAV